MTPSRDYRFTLAGRRIVEQIEHSLHLRGRVSNLEMLGRDPIDDTLGAAERKGSLTPERAFQEGGKT